MKGRILLPETCYVALVAVSVSLALAGCGGGGNGDERATATTRASQTAAERGDTTEASAEPITAAEDRWFRALNGYGARLERELFRSGAVTHASMRREIGFFRGCRTMLQRAGAPGRFRPAEKRAAQACKRLDKAARLLERAIAVSDPGGSVVAGTPEEEQFSRALNGAHEAAGNAQFALQRAQEIAREIKGKLPV